MRFRPAILLLAALLLPAALSDRAAPPPEGGSLAGQLLIASPDMGDPRFTHAVILMVRHDKDGAFGIVINHPVADRSLASLMAAIGDKDKDVRGDVRIYAGGPVETQVGFVVHSSEYRRVETVDIDGRIAVTSSPEVLRDIGHQRGPQKSLIAFGYAGWGPGQLEGEMAQHAWFTAPADPKLIFDNPPDQIWDDAMSRRTREL